MKKLHIGLSDLKKAANASKGKMVLELDIECCCECPCRKDDPPQGPDYCGHPSLPNTFEARHIIDSNIGITGLPKLCPLMIGKNKGA